MPEVIPHEGTPQAGGNRQWLKSGGEVKEEEEEEEEEGEEVVDGSVHGQCASALGRDQFPHTLYEFTDDAMLQTALLGSIRLARVGNPDLLLCEEDDEKLMPRTLSSEGVPFDQWISDLNRRSEEEVP